MSLIKYLLNDKLIKTFIIIISSIFLLCTDIINNKKYFTNEEINTLNITYNYNTTTIYNCYKVNEDIYYYKIINLFFGICLIFLFGLVDINNISALKCFYYYGIIYLCITYINGMIPFINTELFNCNNIFKDIIPYQYYSFNINYIFFIVIGFMSIMNILYCINILNCNMFTKNINLVERNNNNPPAYSNPLQIEQNSNNPPAYSNTLQIEQNSNNPLTYSNTLQIEQNSNNPPTYSNT